MITFWACISSCRLATTVCSQRSTYFAWLTTYLVPFLPIDNPNHKLHRKSCWKCGSSLINALHLSLMFPTTQIHIVKSLVANLISSTTFVCKVGAGLKWAPVMWSFAVVVEITTTRARASIAAAIIVDGALIYSDIAKLIGHDVHSRKMISAKWVCDLMSRRKSFKSQWVHNWITT